VFLGRGPDEAPDEGLREFYERLLCAIADSDLRSGDWHLCDCSGWPDNDSYRNLVTWCWSAADSRSLVVVNLSGADAEARVRLPWQDLGGRTWQLSDRLSGQSFARAGDELAGEGLYVGLGPWASHFLSFTLSDERLRASVPPDSRLTPARH
jgi:hypothetical protein